jgi:hypothetical protein
VNVLVLNCGSSTVKFQLIETDLDRIDADTDRRLASGVLERIGSQALLTFEAAGHAKEKLAEPIRDHRAAVDRVLRWLVSSTSRIPDHPAAPSAIAWSTAASASFAPSASTTRSSRDRGLHRARAVA